MSLSENSRYQRSVLIKIVDAQGNPTQPIYLDALPRLKETQFNDNRYVTVSDSDDWGNLGLRLLGDAKAWWAIAEMNAVIDPFTELEQGKVLSVPSLSTYHFILTTFNEA